MVYHISEATMKNIFVSLAFLIASTAPAFAQNTNWTQFGDTAARQWHFRNGSFEFMRSDRGQPGGALIVQMENKSTHLVDYFKIYVTEEDCARGYGTLVTLSVNNEYITETSFVAQGVSMSASGADLLCAVYNKANSEKINTK